VVWKDNVHGHDTRHLVSIRDGHFQA
jgi:hypothetical protein